MKHRGIRGVRHLQPDVGDDHRRVGGGEEQDRQRHATAQPPPETIAPPRVPVQAPGDGDAGDQCQQRSQGQEAQTVDHHRQDRDRQPGDERGAVDQADDEGAADHGRQQRTHRFEVR